MKKGSSKFKQLLMVTIIGAISILITMFFISQKTTPERKGKIDTKPIINTIEVENKQIQLLVPVIGRITAHEKVQILPEVTGILLQSKKEFLIGQSYQKSEVMLSINQEETELNLKAQRSGLLTSIASLLPELKYGYENAFEVWEKYLQSFDINSTTLPLPKSLDEREKFFVASKGIYNNYYKIKAQEERLEKFIIKAPFDGVVIQSDITPGNLVKTGQPLGILINPTTYDFETLIGIDEMNMVRVGDIVNLKSEVVPGNWQGKISRISRGIDGKSQMVKVFVTVTGKELMDGMFLKGKIISSKFYNAMEIPRKFILNGNTILEYKDGVIHYHKIDVIFTHGEIAVVTNLSNGMLISTKITNLIDGAKVKLDESKIEINNLQQNKG